MIPILQERSQAQEQSYLPWVTHMKADHAMSLAP